MRVDDFDFKLPEASIALRPAIPRDQARMLVVQGDGALRDSYVSDLAGLLSAGDILVLNDTRVLPARIRGLRGQVAVEATLLRHLGEGRWSALAKPGKRLAVGHQLSFEGVSARLAEKRPGGEVVLDFGAADVGALLRSAGEMPLPPYIAGKRAADERDKSDYQTVYAGPEGAVAAPTAGLHFTDALLEKLEASDIQMARLTLHVGAGTFLPVKVEDTRDHRMHAEWGEISPETARRLNQARDRGGRIVAVGTTALRLLESAATTGGQIQPFSGETDIFITPGYEFRAVDVLMTNFHLPRSTLFMLVSAFAGSQVMKAAYAHAIDAGYRFYSYGDASLLFRQAGG